MLIIIHLGRKEGGVYLVSAKAPKLIDFDNCLESEDAFGISKRVVLGGGHAETGQIVVNSDGLSGGPRSWDDQTRPRIWCACCKPMPVEYRHCVRQGG